MRLPLLLTFLILHVAASAASLFSDDERSRIVTYWNAPGRYRIAAPKSAATTGPWQVRLTPEASLWFYGYNRARGAAKAPPTETPGATSPQTAEWEQWVQAKLAYDRYLAQAAADRANAVYGRQTTDHGQQTRDVPPSPGPIPPALLSAAGNPPPFALAVAPLEYAVAFDGGESIVYTDNVAVNPRYAYYRFAQGVMFAGTPLRKMRDADLEALFAMRACRRSSSTSPAPSLDSRVDSRVDSRASIPTIRAMFPSDSYSLRRWRRAAARWEACC